LSDLNERNRELEALVKARTHALEAAIDRLELESNTDWLTGISNRRNFERMLAQEWNRAIRTGLPLGLVILDVDHFKRFNDRYGHQAGDGCLLAIAHALTRTARRAGELVARYGGEEFVVLLPNTTVVHALRVASQIQLGVWSLSLPHADTAPGIVTCSLGVACLTVAEMLTSDDLVRRADLALYRAKRSGRNCVVLATESEAPGEVQGQDSQSRSVPVIAP
jgi:diguanylate cyclase (GGDEF)-like protein